MNILVLDLDLDDPRVTANHNQTLISTSQTVRIAG